MGNDHLASRSYIAGFVASKDDQDVFGKFKEQPDAKYINVLRWYKHISSYSEEERKQWKVAEKVEEEDDDDDDVDLFGDDDEVDEEAEKEKERRRKEAEEK